MTNTHRCLLLCLGLFLPINSAFSAWETPFPDDPYQAEIQETTTRLNKIPGILSVLVGLQQNDALSFALSLRYSQVTNEWDASIIKSEIMGDYQVYESIPLQQTYANNSWSNQIRVVNSESSNSLQIDLGIDGRLLDELNQKYLKGVTKVIDAMGEDSSQISEMLREQPQESDIERVQIVITIPYTIRDGVKFVSYDYESMDGSPSAESKIALKKSEEENVDQAEDKYRLDSKEVSEAQVKLSPMWFSRAWHSSKAKGERLPREERRRLLDGIRDGSLSIEEQYDHISSILKAFEVIKAGKSAGCADTLK